MAVLLIYAPSDRMRAQLLGAALEKAGRTILYAPVGHPVMSPEWQQIVSQDVEKAGAYILLLSKAAADDESIRFRAKLISERKDRAIIPLCFSDFISSKWTDTQPDLLRLLAQHQFGVVDDSYDVDRWAEQCHATLPREPPRCFLSYSSHDIEIAMDICVRLQAHQMTVWRDQASIKPGAEWDSQIEGAIKGCTHFLLVYTASAAASKNVRDELSFARECGKLLIPLLFDNTNLPLRVHRAQAVDMRSSIDDGIQRLVTRLLE